MNAFFRWCSLFCLLMLGLGVLAQGTTSSSSGKKQTTIRVRDLAKYLNNYVVVEGITGQKKDDPASNTKVYSLVDDYNDPVWVRTKQDFPGIGSRFRVNGTVIRDGNDLFLIEDTRESLSGNKPGKSSDGGNGTKTDDKGFKLSTTAIIGIAFIGVAILITVILFVVMGKQKARERMLAEQQRQAAEMERMRLEAERQSSSRPGSSGPAIITIAGDGPPPQPAGGSRPAPSHTIEAWGQVKIASGPHSGLMVPLTGRQFTIGRTEGDLKLPNDAAVSSQHGEIVVTNDGRLLYVDKSRNGSQVDGKPVHRTQVEITPKSVIEVGGSQLELIARLPGIKPAAAPEPVSQAKTMVGEIVPPLPPSAAKTGMFMGVELVVVTGPDAGKRLPVGKSVVSVGRREDQEVMVTDSFVSREHLTIALQNGTWQLTNKSEKGTLVNGDRVESASLKHGDRIAIGSTVIEFTTMQGVLAETADT